MKDKTKKKCGKSYKEGGGEVGKRKEEAVTPNLDIKLYGFVPQSALTS